MWATCTAVIAGSLALLLAKESGVKAETSAVSSRLATTAVFIDRDRTLPPLAGRGVLSPKLHTRNETPSQSRVHAEVAGMVAVHGEEKTAAQFSRIYSGSRAQHREAIEALAVTWAANDPVAASHWLMKNTGQDGRTAGMLEPDLWEAAVSGYIEGVAGSDSDTAANLASLLTPQTRFPAANPGNRRARLEPEISAEKLTPEKQIDPEPLGTRTEFDTESRIPAEEEPTGGATDDSGTLPAASRDPRFPGDPGFPGDPDYLTPR